MPEQLNKLRERLAELIDLRNAGRLLEWDQQTMMPPRGSGARANAIGTLEGISHDRFVDAETGRLIDAAADELDGASPDSDDARLVAVSKRRYDKARRVPAELAAELARAASLGQEAWVGARQRSDFASFAPYLKRNLELTRRYVDCFEGFDHPYDVVLDDYEPGMKTAEMTALFAELRARLVPLIASVAERTQDDSCLHGLFGVERQRQLVSVVTDRMGYTPQSWRIDDAVHPFATSLGPADVRITTRWDESYFASGLYGAMHECGHGLYEAGIDSALERTPLGTTESLGLHESQSRMWENMVGRSSAFCRFLAPHIAQVFPESHTELEPDQLFRAVNRVQPSFIRVEADEATYGLHVVLRFELEQQLIDGSLAVDQLPDAWNALVKEYLGLDVPDDATGVLQDVHWSAGLIGYFPTYAIGNIVAGQLWARATEEIADLEQSIAAGELAPLRDWLREHVHRHGAKFSLGELLERVVGGPISVAPYMSYLEDKLSAAYGIGSRPDPE
jgi:carboxypeptidase Taq